MGYRIIIQYASLLVFTLGLITNSNGASAREHDRPSSESVTLQEATRTAISGVLRCEPANGDLNTRCDLQIVNRESGEILRITGSDSARRLFQNGETQVIASGFIRGHSFRILEIRAE